MTWKKIGRALLLLPVWLLLALTPVCAAFLVYAMVFVGAKSACAIVSYCLAAYILTVWCVRLPYLIRIVRMFCEENRYVRRWRNDPWLRVKASLCLSLLLNAVYAAFQLGLSLVHASFWFASLAGYYLSLSVMRFFLLRYTRKHTPGARMRAELLRYRACGIVLLILNLALTAMIVFMVHGNRSFHHHEITTIAMAAYTFTAFSIAIVNTVRYRRYSSPVFSASKAISLASACVSVLTLESTMLTTFGEGTADPLLRTLLLSLSGAAVSVFIVGLAVFMIAESVKKLKLIENTKE